LLSTVRIVSGGSPPTEDSESGAGDILAYGSDGNSIAIPTTDNTIRLFEVRSHVGVQALARN
jgi:hypothetical protein